MPKIIESPVAHWPGTITITDTPTLDQVGIWSEANASARQHTQPVADEPGRMWITSNVLYVRALLPATFAFAQKWELGGGFPKRPTRETLPTKPIGDLIALLRAVDDAIAEVVAALAEDLPNE